MAKSRKKAARTARKKRPTRAKRTKMSRRMIGRRKVKTRKTAAPRPAKRAARKPKGVIDQMAAAIQKMADVAQETQEMRQRMGTRGGLAEG